MGAAMLKCVTYMINIVFINRFRRMIVIIRTKNLDFEHFFNLHSKAYLHYIKLRCNPQLFIYQAFPGVCSR